jgi:hypothetical protein
MEKLPDKNENSYWPFRQPIAAQDMYLMEQLPDENVEAVHHAGEL